MYLYRIVSNVSPLFSSSSVSLLLRKTNARHAPANTIGLKKAETHPLAKNAHRRFSSNSSDGVSAKRILVSHFRRTRNSLGAVEMYTVDARVPQTRSSKEALP